MRTGKKFTSGFLPMLLAIAAMLLAGCSSNGAAKQAKAPASQQVFREGIGGISDINTFDPGLSSDSVSNNAIAMIFTGMVQENDNLQVQAQMASSWDISKDGLTYTFHLKPNLKFSDGTPLTSHDVAYSIDRALSPAIYNTSGVSLTYLGLLKDAAERTTGAVSTLIGDSINTPNNSTVVLTIQHSSGYFLQALTYPTACVVEKSVIDKWGAKWTDHLSDNGGQGGDGPFVVNTYNHSTGITFTPNPYYYGAKPQLKKVEMLWYKDTETAYKAYQANEVDFVNVPPDDNAAAQQNVAEYHTAGQLTIFYITMNYLWKPFDNTNIRQAFELAINKDEIVKNIEKGEGIPTCHMVPQGMPGYDSGLTCPAGSSTRGDITKAKQLFQEGMQQEGYTLANFPAITLTYGTGSPDVTQYITTMIQAWQEVLGVTVKANAIDFNSLLQQAIGSTCQTPNTPQKCLNQGLQMWDLGWIADYPDPQDWTTLQVDKGAPYNEWNYGQNFSSDAPQQVATQKLLEKADRDLGSDRMSLYNQAEQQMVNDVVWLSLYQAETVVLLKKYVQGVVLNAQALTPPDDWGNIYVSVH